MSIAIEPIHFLIAIVLVIVFVGLSIKDAWITILGGLATTIVGIYVIANGFAGIDSTLISFGMGIIMFGIGIYVVIRSSIEMIPDF